MKIHCGVYCINLTYLVKARLPKCLSNVMKHNGGSKIINQCNLK